MLAELKPLILKPSNDYGSELHRKKLAKWFHTGDVIRLCTGRYIKTSDFHSLTLEEQYALRILSTASRTSKVVVSHTSAAFLHGLFLPQAEFTKLPSFRAPQGTNLNTARIKLYKYRTKPELTTIEGIRTTSLAQTLIDCSRELSGEKALCLIDDALHSKKVLKKELDFLIQLSCPVRFRTRIQKIIDFSTAQSDSHGESLTRWNLHQLGAPKPVLQYPIRVKGYQFFVDFAYPEYKLFLEFDGRTKYRGSYGVGSAVLEKEKWREDLIREATGFTFKRITWEIAKNPALLAKELRYHLPLNAQMSL
ncbi:MAG: hypothetical protein QM632_05215 [Micrococcaceae bacterium]